MIINPIDLVVDGLREYAGKGTLQALAVGAVMLLPVVPYTLLVLELATHPLDVVLYLVGLLLCFATLGVGMRE